MTEICIEKGNEERHHMLVRITLMKYIFRNNSKEEDAKDEDRDKIRISLGFKSNTFLTWIFKS